MAKKSDSEKRSTGSKGSSSKKTETERKTGDSANSSGSSQAKGTGKASGGSQSKSKGKSSGSSKSKSTAKSSASKQSTSKKKASNKSGTKASSGTASSETSSQPAAEEVRPAPSTTEGLGDAQRKLIATIEDALPKLSEESLALIVRNCQVALYNEEMERSRDAVLEAQSAVEQGRVPGAKAGVEVDIEQVSEQSFVVIFGSERIFFTRDELRELTRLCWSANNSAEGGRSIFRWMERERRDFLIDAGVDSPSDPGLQQLWSVIRSRYKAR